MFDVKVVPSIEQIGRENWNACFAGELEDYDYLLAVERAGLEGFQWRYAAVVRGGDTVAAAPGFVTEYKLDTTLVGAGKRVVQGLTSLFPSALTLKLACLGSPCTETVMMGLRDDVPAGERAAVVKRLVDGFASATRAEGCGLQAVKDVATPQMQLCESVLHPAGYRAVPGLPVAHLDIDFGSMDAYFARMSQATRKDMRRKLRSLSGIRVERRSNIDDVMDCVMQLYADTRSRAEMQFETLTPAYFRGVLSLMGDRATCTLYYRGADLLAINLLLRDGTTLLDKFFCMDGASGRESNLYFLSWFVNVQYCLENGLRRYQSGQAAYSNKLRLGSRLTRTSMYFRHRNTIVNQALKLAAPIFVTDPAAHLPRARCGGRMSDQPSSNTGIRGTGFYLAWLALPVLSLAVQVLAKVSAGATAGRGAGLWWFFDLCRLESFRFMVACEAASFLAWIVVLSAMPLSEAFPLSAVSYVFVLVASWTLFDEPVSWMQIAGSCWILVGIWLIARTSQGARS